jgi:hypothetical protein
MVSPSPRPSSLRRPRLSGARSFLGAVLAASIIAGATTVAGAATASPPPTANGSDVTATTPATTYTFTTLDSSGDPTFNQLLGINDQQVIAGYFGSGTPPTTHPNKGYTIDPPYAQANYSSENFPGSQQTQVTAINDFGNTAGFYNDAAGHSHPYEYNVNTKKFVALTPPNAASAIATGINDEGDVVGTLTTAKNVMEGFLLKGVTYTDFEINGSTQTMALGVNDLLQIVGSYVDSANTTNGFVENNDGVVTTVDDPNGTGGTTVNGINNGGSLVGFYGDSATNTDGFLAVPTPYPAD